LGASLLTAAGAAAGVHLSAGSNYTANSSSCHHARPPGTTCEFNFHASSNGYALRLVGRTVVSKWTCGQGGGEALLGGKVAGNDPVPLVILKSNGTLYGSTGHGPNRVSVTGHIAEAGTKAVIRFHLVNRHCVTPKVILIEGVAAHGGAR
jgi:hypothetical protein